MRAETFALPPAWTRMATVVAAGIAIAGAVMTLVLVVRIGHLGSQAAWTHANLQSLAVFSGVVR